MCPPTLPRSAPSWRAWLIVFAPGSGSACTAGEASAGLPSTAACTLIHLGWKAKDALAAIQAARGCVVPDTEEQMRWILKYKAQP